MTLSDDRAHAVLFRAIAADRLRIDIDPARVRHLDCPVSGGAYHTLQIYLSGGAGVVALFRLSALWAFSAIVAIVLLNLVVLAPFVARATSRHVVARIAGNPDLWARMWRFGGVTLTLPDGVSETAPKGDWRRIARLIGECE